MGESVGLSRVLEQGELVELGWLGGIGSKLGGDVLLPAGVPPDLLGLNPLIIGGCDWLILLRGWCLTNGDESIAGNGGWVLESDVVAVDIDTVTTSWQRADEGLVLVHGWGNIF